MLPKSAHSNLDREHGWLEVDSWLELDSGSSYLLLSERKGDLNLRLLTVSNFVQSIHILIEYSLGSLR